MILAIIILLTGCVENDKGGKSTESVAKRTGDKVGKLITDFASGVGKGIDDQLMVNIEISQDIINKGITVTTSKQDKMKGITIYMISETEFKSTLIAKALNKEGHEIGRSTVDVEFTDNDAKYVTFTFPDEMDSQLVEKYVINIKK